jgi:putative phage-type endonuclease
MSVSETTRDEWLDKRRLSIGASEVSAVLGLSPWKSPYALWAEKTGLAPLDGDETDAQRWGLLLETAICDEYSEQTGRTIIDHGRYATRYSATCPVLSCTLDREIEAIDNRGNGVLEVKNVGPYKDADWQDSPPLIYQIQVQAQLEVTGLRWGSLAVLIGGQKFRWIDVERDDAFIEVMRKKCVDFWNLVTSRTPPAIDGSDSTADVLRRMFPSDCGESVALPSDALEWDAQYHAANAAIKEAEEKKQEAMNRILEAIGPATFGVLPAGQGRWKYATVTRKAYSVETKTMRVPRRLSK